MKRFNAAKALRNEESFYRPVEKAILFVFTELIYKPIFEIVKEEITDDWVALELPKIIKARKDAIKDGLRTEIKRNKEDYSYLYHNAKMKEAAQNPLIKAILSGRVQYIGEHFEGTFSGAISREIKALGGVWDWRRKKWHLPVSKLSPQVSLAIGTASGKISRLKSRISAHLDEVNTLISQDPKFTFERAFEQTVKGLNKKFEEGIEGIVVAPEFTPEMLKNIAEQYSDNMNLYVRGWTEKSIKRLRDRVLINTFEGNRAEHLVRELEHDYNISFNKAKFLARQETSLLMSQFREERYKSCGVTKYIWSTSGDERVRPYHKRLNGKVFTWDNPPVVDEMGHRKHPGQDFNCYHKDTEVYTEDGFKLIKDVKVGEKVLTIDPNTQNLEWAKCTSTFSKYAKYIAHLNSFTFDLKTDPDHTFFVYKDIDHGKNKHKQYGTKISYTREPQFRTGIERISNHCNFYRSSKWIGKTKARVQVNGLSIPTADFCRLMGYYLSEGNVDNREDRNGIKISQKTHIDKMFNDLAYFNPRKGKDSIWIFNAKLKEYLTQFGYCYEKYVPQEIRELDAESIRIFLDAYALGDGCLAKRHKGFNGKKELNTYNQYMTSSKKMADTLAECVIKAGMGVSIYFEKEKGKQITFRNGTYTLNHDLYTVQELKTQYSSVKSMNKELEEYNDTVYDIEVSKNHTLLIKTGKCVHWNSNCRCLALPVIK